MAKGVACAVIGPSCITYGVLGWKGYDKTGEPCSQKCMVFYNEELAIKYFGQRYEIGFNHYIAKAEYGFKSISLSKGHMAEPYALQLYGDPAMELH